MLLIVNDPTLESAHWQVNESLRNFQVQVLQCSCVQRKTGPLELGVYPGPGPFSLVRRHILRTQLAGFPLPPEPIQQLEQLQVRPSPYFSFLPVVLFSHRDSQFGLGTSLCVPCTARLSEPPLLTTCHRARWHWHRPRRTPPHPRRLRVCPRGQPSFSQSSPPACTGAAAWAARAAARPMGRVVYRYSRMLNATARWIATAMHWLTRPATRERWTVVSAAARASDNALLQDDSLPVHACYPCGRSWGNSLKLVEGDGREALLVLALLLPPLGLTLGPRAVERRGLPMPQSDTQRSRAITCPSSRPHTPKSTMRPACSGAGLGPCEQK